MAIYFAAGMFAFAVIFALTAVYFDDKKKTSTSRQ
jgi:hypothetical protein